MLNEIILQCWGLYIKMLSRYQFLFSFEKAKAKAKAKATLSLQKEIMLQGSISYLRVG